MDRYKVYGFLDTPVELMGIPLDRALALILPIGFGTAFGAMGSGIIVGAIIFVLYSQIAKVAGFNLAAKLLSLGISFRGCMPPPKITSDYCW